MWNTIKFSLLTVLLSSSILSNVVQAAPNSDSSMEQAVLVHINQYRQQHGLSQLTMDSRISHEAKIHSQDMASHRVGFGHTHFQTRIKHLHQSIKDSNAGAENVAYNYRDAQDVVKNWLTSPGHKRNIDGNYTHTGVGIARDSRGKIYFTQIFLKRGNGTKYVRKPLPRLLSSLFK